MTATEQHAVAVALMAVRVARAVLQADIKAPFSLLPTLAHRCIGCGVPKATRIPRRCDACRAPWRDARKARPA